MLVVLFSPVIVAGIKLLSRHDFVAPLEIRQMCFSVTFLRTFSECHKKTAIMKNIYERLLLNFSMKYTFEYQLELQQF